MPWWLLLAFIFVVWCLWAVAATAQVEVENARRPSPNGQRRGMSPAPVIPVFPLVLWGAAALIDLVVDPWGTIIFGSLHAVFAVILVVSIVHDLWRLRSSVAAEPDAAAARPRE
jgi:hypothetical protein